MNGRIEKVLLQKSSFSKAAIDSNTTNFSNNKPQLHGIIESSKQIMTFHKWFFQQHLNHFFPTINTYIINNLNHKFSINQNEKNKLSVNMNLTKKSVSLHDTFFLYSFFINIIGMIVFKLSGSNFYFLSFYVVFQLINFQIEKGFKSNGETREQKTSDVKVLILESKTSYPY